MYLMLKKNMFIAAILLCSSQISAAQIFECKDAKGRKIIANRCPLGSTIVKEIEVAPVANGQGQAPANKLPQQSLWAKEIEFKERQKLRKEQEDLARDKQRKDEEKCYQNKKRLETLLNGLPLSKGDNAKGEPIYMEDAARLDEIKKITVQMKNCKENQD
ncbi:hypothetical protein [Undibacterium sp.]|uniref:hypothetical protein n=1 Tax=Undibacterium sp. TaxID=1914977 RepID=UPI003751C546